MKRPSTLADRLSWLPSLLFFDGLIYLYTVVMGTLSLLSSVFDRGGRIQHWFARTWSRMIMATIFSPVEVVGLDRLDTSRPCMYAFNHLSALDIPLIYANLPFQFRIVAKLELFRYPFTGWHLRRSGQIPVDRSSAHATLRSLNRAVESLRSGMPLVVFPEGGRSATGQVMPFLPGVFYAAIKAQVAIVPVALVGTYELLPMNTFRIRPRRLYMLVGEPIAAAGHKTRDMEALADQVRSALEDLYYSRAEIPDPRKTASATTMPVGGL